MPNSQPNLFELAKQGDAGAIAQLVDQSLQSQDITAKVSLKENCLQVMLEADQAPNQQASVAHLGELIASLNVPLLIKVRIYGRQTNEEFPEWQQELLLEKQADLTNSTPPETSETQLSLTGSELAEEKALSVPEQLETQPQANSFWGSIFGTVGAVTGAVVGTAEAIGGATAHAGGAVTGAVVGTAEAIGGATAHAGQAVVGTAIDAGGALANAAMQAPSGAGYVLDLIKNSPQLQEVTKALQIDKLIDLIHQVDIVKAEAHVKHLQKKYPSEQPSEIAHRLMLEKALYVGGTGLASSIMPGFAAAMFAVDLAATTAIQAEMVYQIACAYGLDLTEPARKGEVLAIFGLALGSHAAIEAGLGFARNLPIAGAAIGASSNAAMLYGLGYAACRFYEAKSVPI